MRNNCFRALNKRPKIRKKIQKLWLRFKDKPPLIFISARDDWAARLAVARAGGQVYLSKPLDFAELLNSLDAVGLWADEDPYRVLVVDDEVALAQSYAAILQGAGM